MPLRVIDIARGTSVDGPGLRDSVYLAGCRHACPGCHNPQTWPMDAGHDMTVAELLDTLLYDDFDVTLTGGDPMYQAHEAAALARELKLRGKNVWCYTGFLWEQLADRQPYRQLLETVDVLVDGPFVLARRDTSLLFRGSDNQRIINVPASLAAGTVVPYDAASALAL